MVQFRRIKYDLQPLAVWALGSVGTVGAVSAVGAMDGAVGY